MSEIAYPDVLNNVSKNVKVIWHSKEFSREINPWEELEQYIIRLGQLINVEEILDRRGEEDDQEYF